MSLYTNSVVSLAVSVVNLIFLYVFGGVFCVPGCWSSTGYFGLPLRGLLNSLRLDRQTAGYANYWGGCKEAPEGSGVGRTGEGGGYRLQAVQYTQKSHQPQVVALFL